MQETLYTDLQLLDRLRADDTACFEELYDRHWRMVYMYAIRKLQSREDARKVVSAVFSEVWEERYAIPVEQSLQVLLYQKVRLAVVHCLQERLMALSDKDWADGGLYPAPAMQHYEEKAPSAWQSFGQWLRMPQAALLGRHH